MQEGYYEEEQQLSPQPNERYSRPDGDTSGLDKDSEAVQQTDHHQILSEQIEQEPYDDVLSGGDQTYEVPSNGERTHGEPTHGEPTQGEPT